MDPDLAHTLPSTSVDKGGQSRPLSATFVHHLSRARDISIYTQRSTNSGTDNHAGRLHSASPLKYTSMNI